MSGKKKILALLIGFFVFFYACMAGRDERLYGKHAGGEGEKRC